MKRLKIILGVLLAASTLFCPSIVRGQNNNVIFPTGATYQLNNLVWATTGTAAGFNNNWMFAPFYQGNSCITVSVFSNNPTSSHNFGVAIEQTASPTGGQATTQLANPSDASWVTIGLVPNPVGISGPSGINGAFNSSAQITSGAGLVAVLLSGGVLQAGSPDTANVVITQAQGNCTYKVRPTNQEQVSAANTPITVSAITFNAGDTFVPSRQYLYSISARCSAGTASLIVKDGGTQIWSTAATEIGTTTFRFQWVPALQGSIGNNLNITLSTCGAANTGTLDVQASVNQVSL